MNLFRIYLTVILLSVGIFNGDKATAQDNARIRISLLTCTPGDQLYSIFGHSAFRIVDSTSLTDYVYNYGTFNFEDDGFYLKFIQGKLLYYISLEYYSDFVYAYRAENRGITEQVLDLNDAEKIKLQAYLNENLKEENKFYKYDFFFDNCTTRLRDLIHDTKKPAPLFPATMPPHTTFREAIHLYLDKGQQYWSKLGIDILLGLPTDAVMTSGQQQFLPDNLMYSLDSTTNIRIVQSKNSVFQSNIPESSSFRFTPGIFFSFFLAFYIMLSLYKNPKAVVLLKRLDGLIFFLTGLLGCILIFMWAGTDHSMTKANLNLLWAWPTHLLFSFYVNHTGKWVRLYWLFTAVFLTLVLLSWYFLPQQMNHALIPFVLLLIYRSAITYLKNK